MERIILWRLQETTFRTNPININQHAFQKGRSTDSALSVMVEYIESALIKKKVALGAFLDVKGAFDNLTIKSIIKGLKRKAVDPIIIAWCEHFLRNRSISVTYKGSSTTKYLTKGTPQGSVLSPIYWIIGFEEFLNKYPDRGRVKIVGFADDAALIVTGPKIEKLIELMQKAIDKAMNWGRRNRLEFSAPKTVVVIFTHKQIDIPNLPKLEMNGYQIPYSNEVKYLGVWLDKRLTWIPHITKKINSAKKLLMTLKKAMGCVYGLRPRLLIWAYRAIVRPMLTYGSLVWAKVTRNPKVKEKLKKLQRLALLVMGHFRKSTPTAGLEVMTFTTIKHLLYTHFTGGRNVS